MISHPFELKGVKNVLRDLLNSSVFFQQAEKSNIRLDDVEPLASIDVVLKTQESVQDVIVQEESIGLARAEEQQSNEQAQVYRRQLGDKFCAMVVRIICKVPFVGVLPEEIGCGVCGPLPKTLTLFKTKSVIFPTLLVK